jgi:hypothetical protein
MIHLFNTATINFLEIMRIKERLHRSLLLMPLLLLLLVACEKVTFEPVVISGNVSYKTDIQPIFDSKCTSCHPPTMGIDLTANLSYKSLVPEYAAVSDSANPEGSKLYIQLTGSSHTPRSSETDKQKILKWISQGVPNN